MKVPYFIIDPGHGAKQPGKRSPILEDGRQFIEYKSNWAIAKLLIKQLRNGGIAAIEGEMSLDIAPSKAGQMLSQRLESINAIANRVSMRRVPICISIHSNAFGNTWSLPSGIETYYYDSKHAPDTNMRKIFAHALNNNIVNHVGFKNRGVKPNTTFALLKGTRCLSFLTETGFYTNYREVQEMLKPEFIENAAEGHYQGCLAIADYLKKM